MKYCKKCGLSINTNYEFCPLCASEISSVKNEKDMDEAFDPACDIYPEPHSGRKYNFIFRLFLFITIVTASTCLLINLLSHTGTLWSFIVIGSIQLLWAIIAYPILTKKNIGHCIIVDAISACILFVIIQTTTRTKGWELDYVIPFLLIASTTAISLIILIKRIKWREYAVYQFIMMVLGLLPVIFVISGIVETIWPSIVSAFYSLITFIGMFIFADKKYKNELIRRFHF